MPSQLPGAYAPPGAYTETTFEKPANPADIPAVIPTFVGTGLELLTQSNLPVVRGSSATSDERIPSEDQSGRAVLAVTGDGSAVLGAWDGLTSRFKVRNLPMTTGDGTGTVTTDPATVTVTLNGEAVVVLSVDGETGIVEIAEYPAADALVQCTYYFDRTDTLATDDVSAQVTATAARIDGAVGQNYLFTAGATDQFIFSADGLAAVTVTLPAGVAVSASVVAAAINATAGIGTAEASTFVDNLGATCLRLTADISLTIGAGTANGILGFATGAATARNRTFYTFNGPIVTGSGGGVTTTRPTDVTVTVDGVEVAATAVDGQTRAVTLPAPPRPDASVSIRYYHNTWQDTFDYLAHTGVTSIVRAAVTPESNGAGVYVQGVDYVLKDDTVLWGTAALVSPAVHTEGGALFGTEQVTARLVDQRAYLRACTAVSRTQFRLPEQPTTGNGRDNPLGAEEFLAAANGRSDLPTANPNLVSLYWGYGAQDALARGRVTVLAMDPETSTVTLSAPVPEGAGVFATFYYNTLVDAAFIGSGRGYTLSALTPGNSGVGTYTLTDPQSRSLYSASLSAKGSALSTVTVVFPSGSEFLPDARFEDGTQVEETVQVQFATSDAEPARYTAPGAGPYYLVPGQSSALRVTVDGSAASTGGIGGINLALPTGGTRGGAFASLLGSEVAYDADSGQTTYTVTAGVDDTVTVTVDGVAITGTAAAGTATVAAFVSALNTAAAAEETVYEAAGVFDTSYTVVASEYDQMQFVYTGKVTGSSGTLLITLTPGAYATAALLAAEVASQISGVSSGFTVNCQATADSRLRFLFSLDPLDSAGTFEFLTAGTAARDFATVAGVDTAAAAAGNQTKLYNGPIALRYTVATTAGRLPYDRLVLRNRLLPGAGSLAPFHVLNQSGITVNGGNGLARAGLAVNDSGLAAYRGTALGPNLVGRVGWGGGAVPAATFGDARDGQPGVLFYDGSDPDYPANNVYKLTVNGTLVTVTFTASATGTLTALGPAATAGSILNTMNTALAAAPGTVVAVQEGDSIRIHGTGAASFATTALWIVGDGSANEVLGFVAGTVAAPEPVSARRVASALMSHVQTYATWVLDPTAVGAGYFASRALAGVQVSDTGEEYLYFQSRTLGSASSLVFAAATAADALRTGTGLGIVAGDTSRGSAAVEGFFVTSSDLANGSGSANTSVFNSGVGQDGVVGQTYVDAVTGLRFTVLPRSGGLAYPTGALATLTFRVSRTFVTDANVPTLAVPGVELVVSNTAGVVRGDTARVETYSRAGAEPSVGETYYVSYTYNKADYSPRVFTREQLNAALAEYGPATPEYPLALAADLAFKNGASAVGLAQVRKTAGASTAPESSYRTALDSLAGDSLPGDLPPGVIVLLTPATTTLARHAALHCDVQSSIRYRAERTAIFGFASGTRPDQVPAIVAAAGSTRVRFVYPDLATVDITDVLNRTRRQLVDGRYLAAALAAATTVGDAATPWESLKLYGISSLGRRLDPPTANAIAQRGVTVITAKGTGPLSVRHGLTSDMSSILTKTPTVIQISDEIQRRVRAVMEPYAGKKFLPQQLSQVEGRLSEMFKQAVRDQIITAYKGVSVTIDPEDPTALLAEGWWMPVFPLLYLQARLRVSISQ